MWSKICRRDNISLSFEGLIGPIWNLNFVTWSKKSWKSISSTNKWQYVSLQHFNTWFMVSLNLFVVCLYVVIFSADYDRLKMHYTKYTAYNTTISFSSEQLHHVYHRNFKWNLLSNCGRHDLISAEETYAVNCPAVQRQRGPACSKYAKAFSKCTGFTRHTTPLYFCSAGCQRN